MKTHWLSSVAFDRTFRLGRLSVRALVRRNDGRMGRLGGGWSWKLSLLVAPTTIVLELFVMSIRFTLEKKGAQ